jgi:Dihaem cytochrome c
MKKIVRSLVAVVCAASATLAFADAPLMGNVPPVVERECASCHMVFPPAFLPVASWQRLMADLPRHFGVDASTDAKSTNEISQWLVSQGGTYRRVSATDKPAQDRITTSAWFTRKHREVADAVWQRPSIKSAANCAACHGANAAKGQFNEDAVRIPK